MNRKSHSTCRTRSSTGWSNWAKKLCLIYYNQQSSRSLITTSWSIRKISSRTEVTPKLTSASSSILESPV
ncbi:hypothetical protein Y032_0434g1398 [Ancylostoma ceylanicum]|uniref:Uncharacterized protein n=1 Tax=Ancylostoma ceylanicum TaxID=53326 RepID=A0A016X151_9BILA|nr:hypothetical protein Y032_0434g1398 [Ancylostoma ceylanicum]